MSDMYLFQLTSRLHLAVALAMALAAAPGCSESVDAPPDADSAGVVATPALADASDEPAVVETTTKAPTSDADALGNASDGQPTTPTPADGAPGASAVAEYQPPFPDRVDLFMPPKRVGGTRSKEGESDDAVELLGFVRVDRPRVVLSINGEVHPLYEGARQFGIEVISIQPPKVVLQRGRQRWQASLDN